MRRLLALCQFAVAVAVAIVVAEAAQARSEVLRAKWVPAGRGNLLLRVVRKVEYKRRRLLSTWPEPTFYPYGVLT